MKIIKRIVLSLIGVVATITLLGVVAFWAPDIPRDELVKDYTNEYSTFFTTEMGDIVHYRDQGNLTKPSLVLIHGTAASLHTWEPLVAQLATEFRLVSLDLPGHGLTGEFSSADYSRSVMIDTVVELMDHLDIGSATWVGNSLGGGVVWQAALTHPERVKALVLLAPTGAKRDAPSESNIGFKLLGTSIGRALMKKLTPRFIIEKSLQQTVVDEQMITDDMVDRYWRLLRMTGNRQAMLDLGKSDRRTGLFSRLDNIKQPTLIVWGANDQLLPADMIGQFEKKLLNSESVVLTNIGHLPQEEGVGILVTRLSRFCRHHTC